MTRQGDKVVRYRRARNPWPRRWTRAGDYGVVSRPWWKQVTPLMVVLPLTAFTAVLLWPAPERASSRAIASEPVALAAAGEAELRARLWPTTADELDAAQPVIEGAGGGGAGFAADTAAARFTLCGGGARIDCVVDGDTFWFRGRKIRIADINTPEVSEPGCAREARLGAAATRRLLALLNAGPFTLAANPDGRERDRYGRELRTVVRGGESLGLVLVREGLAEEWRGSRSSWC